MQNDLFWGYRYIVEQLPQYPATRARPIPANTMPSDHLDIKIGTCTFEAATQAQKEYFEALKESGRDRIDCTVWERDTEWEDFLPRCDSQMLYFFSHGHTAKPAALADDLFYDMTARWSSGWSSPFRMRAAR